MNSNENYSNSYLCTQTHSLHVRKQCACESGDLLGLRSLTASPVSSSNSAAVSSAAQLQRSSPAEQGSLEYATSADAVRHEWGSVAQEPSLLYVRREPWDEAAIFPFSAKAFYVGTD